ncbi:branched-chain amino acid ABC transporter permease [Acidovorax cavernicola]|uniref:Branched-chain amino acid ABC transporter permease n=1 Tax=Acidovorax cavernicola TaxID=1675792 RepID=A0A9X8D7U6_9BURK|nr:branched-chain amino acid ABC transporter permease [Acidovorax cavernicola]RIX83250.1 branched-chain amino acid ABC transporter permease [Acidovorax cavernicola]
MELLVQQVTAGLATGAIYACMALAIVMIYRAIGHVNFAQGEMAMVSTYLAWQLIEFGVPYWLAFVLTLVLSFVLGAMVQHLLIRRIRNASDINQIIVFIGVLLVLNSVAGFIWSYTVKPFPSPFGTAPFMGSPLASAHQVGMIGVILVVLLLLFLFFRFTRTGLAMRAAVSNPSSARLLGIRVKALEALGWGMAASIGAIAGILVAPIVFLEPHMMAGIVIYGFAGAVLGGLSSLLGALIGGLLLGVLENLISTFVPVVGGELKSTIALIAIVVVLLVRPQGLIGKLTTHRV